MNLINEEFCNLLPNQFLTENVSLFLYSLLKCSRPQSIIEVGYGYSTLFISKAIQDIQKENLDFDSLLDNKNKFTGPEYNPTFRVIENFEHPHFIRKVASVIRKYKLDKNLQFINRSIDEYLKNTQDNYDLVWMDFGSGKEYMYFFKLFLERLNEGGMIIVHSTITNLAGRLFSTELKLMLKDDSSLEMISIVEPHKSIQNSFTIVKKNADYPIHTVWA